MRTIERQSKKKYRTRESGEYKSIGFFCIYDEKITDQSTRVTCFIDTVFPLYSKDRVDNTNESIEKITKDVIPTALGDYKQVIDGFSFTCSCPLQNIDIIEFENTVIDEVEKILSKLIGNDNVIEQENF